MAARHVFKTLQWQLSAFPGSRFGMNPDGTFYLQFHVAEADKALAWAEKTAAEFKALHSFAANEHAKNVADDLESMKTSGIMPSVHAVQHPAVKAGPKHTIGKPAAPAVSQALSLDRQGDMVTLTGPPGLCLFVNGKPTEVLSNGIPVKQALKPDDRLTIEPVRVPEEKPSQESSEARALQAEAKTKPFDKPILGDDPDRPY